MTSVSLTGYVGNTPVVVTHATLRPGIMSVVPVGRLLKVTGLPSDVAYHIIEHLSYHINYTNTNRPWRPASYQRRTWTLLRMCATLRPQSFDQMRKFILTGHGSRVVRAIMPAERMERVEFREEGWTADATLMFHEVMAAMLRDEGRLALQRMVRVVVHPRRVRIHWHPMPVDDDHDTDTICEPPRKRMRWGLSWRTGLVDLEDNSSADGEYAEACSDAEMVGSTVPVVQAQQEPPKEPKPAEKAPSVEPPSLPEEAPSAEEKPEAAPSAGQKAPPAKGVAALTRKRATAPPKEAKPAEQAPSVEPPALPEEAPSAEGKPEEAPSVLNRLSGTR